VENLIDTVSLPVLFVPFVLFAEARRRDIKKERSKSERKVV